MGIVSLGILDLDLDWFPVVIKARIQVEWFLDLDWWYRFQGWNFSFFYKLKKSAWDLNRLVLIQRLLTWWLHECEILCDCSEPVLVSLWRRLFLKLIEEWYHNIDHWSSISNWINTNIKSLTLDVIWPDQVFISGAVLTLQASFVRLS